MRPGHTLVVPKKEVDHILDLDDETYRGLFDTAKMLGKAIQKATGAKRIGYIVEGFFVPHVHVHLVPINSHEDILGENAEEQTSEEMKKMAEKIKAELK